MFISYEGCGGSNFDVMKKKVRKLRPNSISRLLEPTVLFRNLKDLNHLDSEQNAFITTKLNEHLHSQIINAVGSVSDLMSRNIQRMVTKVDYQEFKESDLLHVIKEKVLAEIKRSNNEILIKEAEEIELRLLNMPSTRITDLLHLDIPLGQNPLFNSEIRTVKIIEYAKLGSLDEETAKKLADRNILYFDDTDDTVLSNLVKEVVINEEQKQSLMLVSSLSKLTADNIPFIKALKTQELKSTANFVSWEIDDWQRLIEHERISLPPNETVKSYAENILFNIKRTYPSQFLVNRLVEKNDSRHKINLLDSLNTLLENNDRLIDGISPANIDWRGIGAETRERMQEDLEQLALFANSYARMGLVSLINNRDLDLAAKKQTINSHLQLVKKFFDNNPELDLRYANFFDTKDNNTNWEGIQPTTKPMIRKQIMAYQRILNITKDPEDSMTLLSKGYDSVMAISEKSESEFIQTSGLSPGKARLIYAKAQRYSEVVAHDFETIRDALKGQFKDIRMATINTKKLANELQEIDGFADLFGSQNFCGCEECMSILSPTAYFVDLMRFIDTNVSQQVFAPPNDHHSLCLYERRKDLWDLELTCDNTRTLIPYLTIANEVLEQYLKGILSQEDIYEKFSLGSDDSQLSTLNKVSFYLPFNLPLEELRIYLNHFSTSLYEIYKTLNLTDQKVWRAKIGLSKEEFAVITTQENPIEDVKFRYGNPVSFTNFPLQDFIRFAGISREQLDHLLSIKFNPDLYNIEIGRQEQDPVADELLQNFEEILNQLSSERLDFIHRFIRLLKKTSWSISELDLVLTSLRDANLISSGLDEVVVTSVAKLTDIQEKLKLNVEELCALFHFLPVSRDYPEPPDNEGDKLLFERTFDPKRLFGVNSATGSINSSTSYHHYSLNTVNPDDKTIDPRTPLLLAGLSISETELLLLFDLLKDEIPFDSNGDCTLDKERISLLYRHAKLAKALGLSIKDFLVALHLNFTAPGNNAIAVTELGHVFRLIEFKEWIMTTPFNVSELYYILEGEETGPIKSGMTLEIVKALVLEIQETQEANKIDALKSRLLTLFNLTPDQLQDILKWVSTDINGNSVETALNTSFTPQEIDGNSIQMPDNPSELDPLITLLKQIESTLLLFSNLKFKEETVHDITSKQQLLGIENLRHLTLDDIKLLATYKKHITLEDDEAESLMQSVLKSYSNNNNAFSSNDIDILAGLWKKDKSLIKSLAKSLEFPIIPIEAIEYLWKCLEISDRLGINGFSLVKLGKDDDYDDLISAREIVLGAFSSKYDDEKIRNEKLEPYRDCINVKKRDILCKYITAREKDLKFKDFGDIYSYFLLDVEMGGCFRTSRLVCAISSLQLYVHRCLVNLERSNEGDINVDPSKIPTEEWEWRKNYRVWEANRKVFLYPENYLEPDLRDNKTPIFKELEDELLQEKITKESAEAAYRKYLSQFAELARLKIAGSYYHNEGGTSTYYFFARTQQEPPQYYYRKWIDNKVWTHWKKIDLSIDSDQVSAIIHLGKLYLFWVAIVATSKINASNIDHITTDYTYSKKLVYSFLNEQEKWIPPQKLSFMLAESNQEVDTTLINKIVFPLKTNLIYVNGYDKFFPNFYKISKLDLFRNKTEDIISNPYGLIPPNSRLLFLELENIFTNNFHFRLKTYRNVARLHEAQFEDNLSYLFFWDLNVDQTGIPVTNYFAQKEFYPELHLVGYRPGDFVFKFGDQQYLIQRFEFLQDHIDPDIPVLDSLSFINLHNADIIGATDKKINYAAAKPNLWVVPRLSRRYTSRLSTSLTDKLGEILFTRGLEEFLSLTTQRKKEDPIGINFIQPSELRGPHDNIDHIDFNGTYGTYYRELFFHIPFLIANHLNANQKFKEAKWWYERIFNPTASKPDSIPSSSERTWQYIEFRDVTIQKMREILTDEAAIETYENDPFNPHAIARLRSSAYQKAIVMKYIDNLIDWGDYLFAQDTMESINEATMLYVLASDILGKRPLKIGACEIAMGTEAGEGEQGAEEIECKAPLTYEKIEACSIGTGTDFLIELENWQHANMIESMINTHKIAIDRNTLADISFNISSANPTDSSIGSVGKSSLSTIVYFKPRYDVIHYADVQKVRRYNDRIIGGWENVTNVAIKKLPASSMIVKPTMLAFCIPPNNDLLAYWDRVEDRLFKIRNCMNISGIRRHLALFQPPISPMALVRAKAAGLTLEEIVMPAVEEIPPYRFSYLVEKAKQFTQTLQNFGSALLSALEKKDVEELTLLRSVHERNILQTSRVIKEKQKTESEHLFSAALEATTNVQNRINYYKGLIDEGLTAWEIGQQVSKHTATKVQFGNSLLTALAAKLYLSPQVGSPFAMKYGGKELGDSVKSAAEFVSSSVKTLEMISDSAGLVASNQRREQEWNEQLKLAEQELKQAQQQQLASELRKDIADKDLALHDKNIEQANELDEFYKNKFTKLGLYDYLSTSLNRLYHEAYNLAYNMGKMTERAYKFETDDDTSFISGDNWQLDNAGLLAGERLLLQLQHMETAYLENNKRDYEVTQSFSLSLLDPEKLISLRQTGSCEFAIPEIMFDLLYPGQYKRLIKSVRLTVPCVVGPYTNVSAKLTLIEGKVRKGPNLGEEDLILAPVPSSFSITTSSAQGDTGTFEFSFRDERYLPFEGAGAIWSKWKLELPSKIRTFDYESISDVILHISYTAKEDSEFRTNVENQTVQILSDIAADTGLFRLISLRHEFPNNFHQLLHPNTGQPQITEFDLEKKHFPYFIAAKELMLSSVKVYLKPRLREGEIDTSGLMLKVNNVTASAGAWNDFGENMKENEVPITGSPIKKWTINAGLEGLDKEEIDDVLILLTYTAS